MHAMGYVYFLADEKGNIKIGATMLDPRKRLWGCQTGNSEQLELVDVIPTDMPFANKTTLEPLDKFYLNREGQICIPVLNVFSLLAAWNTPSVAKRFYGRDGKGIATGVMAYVQIEGDSDDGMMAIVRDEDGKPYTPDDERIVVHTHVARTAQATPNPTTRPSIPTGWTVNLTFEYADNKFLKEPTLRKMIEQGGILGLGTFRPIFGRYLVEHR